MYCRGCGNKLDDNATFCENCGWHIMPANKDVPSGNNAAPSAAPAATAQPVKQEESNRTVSVDSPEFARAYQKLYGQPSEFKGGAFGNAFRQFLVYFVSAITLFLAFPAMTCWFYRWEAQRTYINGRRLTFNGTGGQLFGKILLWGFLTVITIGIYSFWLVTNLKKWKTSHTGFEPEKVDLSALPAEKRAEVIERVQAQVNFERRTVAARSGDNGESGEEAPLTEEDLAIAEAEKPKRLALTIISAVLTVTALIIFFVDLSKGYSIGRFDDFLKMLPYYIIAVVGLIFDVLSMGFYTKYRMKGLKALSVVLLLICLFLIQGSIIFFAFDLL